MICRCEELVKNKTGIVKVAVKHQHVSQRLATAATKLPPPQCSLLHWPIVMQSWPRCHYVPLLPSDSTQNFVLSFPCSTPTRFGTTAFSEYATRFLFWALFLSEYWKSVLIMCVNTLRYETHLSILTQRSLCFHLSLISPCICWWRQKWVRTTGPTHAHCFCSCLSFQTLVNSASVSNTGSTSLLGLASCFAYSRICSSA
jgi:hypothetical protein